MIDKKIYKSLNGKSFIDVQIRKAGDTFPRTVGESATLNFIGKAYKDPELKVVILSENKEILSVPADEVEIWFHEGFGGIDVIHKDDDGNRTTVIMHFTSPVRVQKGKHK